MRSAAASAVASSASSSLTNIRSAWNVRVAGWICARPGADHPPDDVGQRLGGDGSALPCGRRRWRARRAREWRSSPSWKMMSARSRSEACATTSAALGPSRPMRMSSGPSSRNEKPRGASSSCIEDTPRSSTTPSTAAWPNFSATRSSAEKRSSIKVSRPLADCTRPAPFATAAWSRSMPMTCAPPAAREFLGV